jgi:hypothetical protein
MHPATTSSPGYIVTHTLKPMQKLINWQSNVTQSVEYPLDVHRVTKGGHNQKSNEIKKKVKWSRYRPGVAQRVVRGIALLFHDRGTRRGWVVNSTPRPNFTPGKDSIPILQEAGWAPGLVWTGWNSRPHRDSIPDRPARSQSLHGLSYPAHTLKR